MILTNVGTPQSPSPEDVGDYLREFLMDEDIIQIPRPFRDVLVKVLIVPRRKFSSAEKYQRIWTEQGSPLMVESLRLKDQLAARLGPEWRVEIAMQVGKPSIRETMSEALKESSEIYFCPLYPQYATATTGGAVKAVRKHRPKNVPLKILEPFYKETWFIAAQAQLIAARLQPQDHLLLSYHGLPVSQLKKHRPECRLRPDCCAQEASCVQNCYQAQCFRTTELLTNELRKAGCLTNGSERPPSAVGEFQGERISMGFQSRLGRGEWIGPSTVEVVEKLLKQGVRHLKVACPSFVADCLETLEEIGIELREQFLRGGGESFELISCVNSHPEFVDGLAQTLDPK